MVDERNIDVIQRLDEIFLKPTNDRIRAVQKSQAFCDTSENQRLTHDLSIEPEAGVLKVRG